MVKKWFFSCNSFKKSETFIYFRCITCKVKHLKKNVFFNFDEITITANESQKSVSQNIRIFTFEFQ